jgi:hypothetical protein
MHDWFSVVVDSSCRHASCVTENKSEFKDLIQITQEDLIMELMLYPELFLAGSCL